MRPHHSVLTALPLLAALAACDDGSTQAQIPTYVSDVPDGSNIYAFDVRPPSEGGSPDASKDARSDVATDATTHGDATPDSTSPVESGPTDAHHADAVMGSDAAHEDANDAATVTHDGGGRETGTHDSATTDGASGGAPVCMTVGTTEGWYTPGGTLLCANACAGLTATCERIGTTSQGWYSAGHGCPPHADEIENDPTCRQEPFGAATVGHCMQPRAPLDAVLGYRIERPLGSGGTGTTYEATLFAAKALEPAPEGGASSGIYVPDPGGVGILGVK